MNSWWYLVIILAIGLPGLALAAWADHRSRIRQRKTLAQAPDREIPNHDGPEPSYIPADDVLSRPVQLRTLEPAESEDLDSELADAIGFSAGWASDRFATHRDPIRAIVDEPLVLLCDEVGALRELLTPMQRARQLGHPLVIVAEHMNSEVIDTLAANRLRLDLGLLAVIAKSQDQQQLADELGALRSTRIDLQSGYVPTSVLPLVQRWVSNSSESWITLKSDVRVDVYPNLEP